MTGIYPILQVSYEDSKWYTQDGATGRTYTSGWTGQSSRQVPVHITSAITHFSGSEMSMNPADIKIKPYVYRDPIVVKSQSGDVLGRLESRSSEVVVNSSIFGNAGIILEFEGNRSDPSVEI